MRFILFFLIVFASNSMKSQTFVNDSIFEQMLIDLGYDDSIDNILINSIIDTIDTLNIRRRQLQNLGAQSINGIN